MKRISAIVIAVMMLALCLPVSADLIATASQRVSDPHKTSVAGQIFTALPRGNFASGNASAGVCNSW